jgi:hypothetical protein
MADQHPNQIGLQECIISKLDGKGGVIKKRTIKTDMIISFDFMESITSPFVSGSLLISDSKDFLNTFPIEGGEEVAISMQHTFDENPIDFNLRVYKVGGRVVDGKKQVYTLMLVSSEAIINESFKVQDPLDGNPESIIGKLLREKLRTSKEIFSEPSRFKVRMIPGNLRVFDIIAKLIKKSVSTKTTYGSESGSNNTGKSEQQIKGSAGFFFWETNRGYNCFSVDALCDVSERQTFAAPRLKSESWGPYFETIANIESTQDSRFNIISFNYSSEVDIMSSLRLGKYSTKMVFFNHSTGEYAEYVYKMKNSYDDMAHLGGQSTVSTVPGTDMSALLNEASENPARVMSAILDPETWIDESKVTDPDVKDAVNPTEYADWTKYYAAQSVARYDLLRNQEATLKIPCNPLICAGDKIDLRFQSKLSDTLQTKKPYDTESSGIYLVKEVTHTFNFVNSGTSGNGFTTLRLFRDSYGSGIEPSKYGE